MNSLREFIDCIVWIISWVDVCELFGASETGHAASEWPIGSQ